MTKRRTTKPTAPAMPSVFAAYDAMSAAGVLDCRETSALKPQAESYAEKYPNDRWELYEKLPKFRAWACDPFVHTNGARYRYAVVSRDPFPGLGWVCLVYVGPLFGQPPVVCGESAGAFYDGADDHPEGAVEWAKAGALLKKAHLFDGAEWLDEKWWASLVSLGYKYDDARVMAIRKPGPASITNLVDKLSAIKVLWLQPNTLALWGIPYSMREGQSPNDLARAHRNWEAPKPGHYGPNRIDISDWIFLGYPGWWGSMARADIDAIKAWLDLPHVKPCIPGNPCEWSPLDEPGKESA